MIHFEHDKTLIVGERKAAPEWTTFEERIGGVLYEPLGGGRFAVTHIPGIRRIEWTCPCGASGPGFPPELHASGACAATKTTVLPAGYVDGGGI